MIRSALLSCALTLTIFGVIFGALPGAMAVRAAPPPPPPSAVWDATPSLAGTVVPDAGSFAALFADDVVATENGRTVAQGKAAWLAWRAAPRTHRPGRLLGLSRGHDGAGGGALLVIDTFDTIDRSALPPTVLADPRMATRSTLYRFGADGLVHSVQIATVDGFWEPLRP